MRDRRPAGPRPPLRVGPPAPFSPDYSLAASPQALASTGLVRLMMEGIGHFASPADAARRSPSPRPAAPPATRQVPCAREGESPSQRVAPAALRLHRRARQPAVARQAMLGRPAVGSGGSRRTHARAGSPPRAPRGDGGDRVTRGSTAWSGRPAPSGARDAPVRTGRCTPGSGSSGLDAAAPAAAPAESSAAGLRPPRSAPPRRAASPPGSRRTPAAATFPRERGSPLPARIGRVAPDPPARRRPRGPLPGTARPGPRDRARDAAPSRPAGRPR